MIHVSRLCLGLYVCSYRGAEPRVLSQNLYTNISSITYFSPFVWLENNTHNRYTNAKTPLFKCWKLRHAPAKILLWGRPDIETEVHDLFPVKGLIVLEMTNNISIGAEISCRLGGENVHVKIRKLDYRSRHVLSLLTLGL